MRKLSLALVFLLFLVFVSADTYLLGDTVVYDTFNDGVVNTTKFVNITSTGGANSINTITETGGYLQIEATQSGGSGEYDVGTNTSLFPPLDQLKNISLTVRTATSHVESGTKSILYFGDQVIYDTFADGGDDTSTYRLDRLASGSYQVYKDGVAYKSITPTTNQFRFRNLQSGGAGRTAFTRIWALNYTTYDPSFNVTSISPTDGGSSGSLQPYLNVTIEPHNGTLINTTFYVWNSTGLFNQTTVSINSVTTSYPQIQLQSIDLTQTYEWNFLTCIQNNSLRCEYYSDDNNLTFTGLQITEYFEPELIELQSATNLMNLTFENINTSISAYLVWNNTEISTTKNVIDTSTVSFSSSFNVPVDIGTTTGNNISFHWRYYLNDNSINATTTAQNQTVFSLDVDTCSAYTNPLINITMFDEDDLTLINATDKNTSIEIELNLRTSDATTSVNINETFTQVNPATLCVNTIPSSSSGLRLDSTIKYSANDYVTEYYGLQNESYDSSNFPKLLSVYDLLTSRSQEFLINYKDSNFIPVSGALIEITRKYVSLGQFLTVEIPETDSDGRTIGHFVLNDEIYTINVKKDGVLLATFENVRAFCTNTATGNCQIDLNQLASTTQINSFQNQLGVDFYNTYNSTTQTYSFVFANQGSSLRDFEVRGTLFDGNQNLSVCGSSVSATSGSLTCQVSTDYQNQTIIFESLIDSEIVDTRIIRTPSITLTDASRYILAFILIITVPLIAITSGAIVTLVFFLIGFIIAGTLALVSGSALGVSSAFLWLVVAVLILIFKIRRQDG
jgi:hypothetical protein